jgi:L-alanine-DL-glutamate epimerase-like enolase superfamily enzyme
MNTTVEEVEQFPVRVPFREVPGRHMPRELPHWRYFEVVRVELASGHVGWGETMLFYTWGRTEDADVEHARGANAADLMWDDSLGPGLQMALFDAVGRALEVPVHELLGEQVNERAPLSWWCIEMDAEDWLSECHLAIDRGYTNIKLKARPWFDLVGIVDTLCAELPDWFEIDLDFNDTLLNAEDGLPVLEELEQYEQVSHFETPIPQEDVEGNRRIRESVETPLAHHYGRPDALTAIREEICDGFILTGGADRLRDEGAVAAMANMPLWLQLVGTGITAAFSLHLGAVLESNEWPAINCHQMYAHDLLTESIRVEDGTAPVPDEPGLGHRVDRSALERFAVERPDSQPYPERLTEVAWDGGPVIYYAGDDDQLLNHAREGGMPYFRSDVTTRFVPDDGSDRWRDVYERAVDAPVHEDEPLFD